MAEQIKLDLVPDIIEIIESLPTVEDKVKAAAEEIAGRARSLVHNDSGAYSESIRVEKTNRSKSGLWRVIASDPKAFFVEFGGPARGIPAQYVMRRAAESLGLPWQKKKK
jgi:hypothetical protein